MTTPNERERAIVETGKFLSDLAIGRRTKWTEIARRLLRHYPTETEAKWAREREERERREHPLPP